MVILFTSDLSGMGGGETSLLNLCKRFNENRSYRVLVMCTKPGRLTDELSKIGIMPIIYDYKSKIKFLKTLFFLHGLIKQYNIECIHSNDPTTSIIFFLSSIGLNTKNFWTCHGQWYKFSRIKAFLLKHANNHIFCVSTSVKTNLSKMNIKNTEVSYLGIDLKDYFPIKPYYEKNNNDVFVFFVIGRFQKIKGQLKAVKAFEKLREINNNFVVHFIGGCIFDDEQDVEYFNIVKEYISNNGLSDILFLDGERADLEKILRKADAVVVPSDNESFGMMAIEALAAGVPVLSTPNDGVSEILEYNSEFIAPTNDSDGLFLLLKEFMLNIDIRKRASEYCRERSKDFDIDKIYLKYEAAFEDR